MRRKNAGTITIGTMTARQISGKITKDLKAANAFFSPSPQYGWSTRVWIGGVHAFCPRTPLAGAGIEDVMIALEEKGYTVTRREYTLTLSHPSWND